MKIFLFVMMLATPGGEQAPYQEQMPSLEACLSKVMEAQTAFNDQDEAFNFMAGCVQLSKKTDPA